MKTFLRWLTVCLILSATPSTLLAADKAKPNIIFIMADDLGYGDLGCYGQKQIRTPNIDRLATEGMRFTNFYSGSTVCAPARCTLMTGLHTGHCLIRGNRRVDLRPEDVTVAKVLKNAGYVNGMCGKWGLGKEGGTGLPTRQGFDFFYGYLDQGHAHNYYTTYLIRNDKRVPLDNVVPNEDSSGHGVASVKNTYSHDLIMNEALGFLDRNHDRPFFLYLPVTIPHANNQAGDQGMEVPSHGIYADKDWPEPEKGRAAMISYLDRDIGRLMKKLKQHGLDDNTIVMFTSDNGPHDEGGSKAAFFNSSGPLRGVKRDLTEGGIRVPMIVRWPGKVKAGSESDHISALWDFMPTAAEIAGTISPKDLDGISFLPTILGKKQNEQHEYLYWEFHEYKNEQAVRFGRWKAIRGFNQPVRLYDLATDLTELKNLAQTKPELAAQATEYLDQAHTESKHWRIPAKKK